MRKDSFFVIIARPAVVGDEELVSRGNNHAIQAKWSEGDADVRLERSDHSVSSGEEVTHRASWALFKT